VREDLENLRPLIDGLAIEDTPSADYPFRAAVTREAWQAAVASMIERLDWDNFKAMVAERQGVERAHIYETVWADLLALQDDTEVGQ
jgi:hypothetical protein